MPTTELLQAARPSTSTPSTEKLPLAGYGALVLVYAATAGAFLGVASSHLPKRIELGDVLLLGVATHKLARIVAKDRVTSPLRAPFVTFVRTSGAGEVEERSRGVGIRRAIGDLLTCPWCMAPWVALGLVATFVAKPRIGRALATLLCTVAVSDWMQHGYVALKRATR